MTPTAAPPRTAAPGPAAAPPRRRSRAFGSATPARTALRYLLLLAVLFLVIGPFLWQLSTSLKSADEDVYTATPHFLPESPTLANYAKVADTVPVWTYAANSLVVAAIAILGNVVGCTLAGYALAKLRFRGARLVLGLFLATLILPGEATIVSQYVTVRSLGLADSLVGVALPGALAMLNVLLMRTAFAAVPPELDQAALVDGANVWQRLWHVGLPNVRGMLSVIVIFTFIGAWDDFLWPLIVLNDPQKYTLTVGLQYLNGTFSANPRLIAAGTMIAFLPIVLVFAVCQRFFFQGVEEGAVKG
ncbi:carbohydrate ABC transporter permease [Kitasatospora sp. CM 4170]|uniref:Carbohydrate ABC transporter permease n=1 Tax=Kitasatospora aburaviensis TaxID=67265 RepID=A0ABW1EPZ4_9ACTN|nr:carbohydrate ABC transporter permease [Kitasatospora sp. CM 4170]WNM44545.1 carbohydrate ABC transporter permease [Kitasatospora sp. CM 4170]